VGLAIELEKGGVPTVAVHTHVFARLARSVARVNGMPNTRQAFVPQPVVGRSPGELRAYIEGDDPVSGRIFMQELLEGLTAPLDDEDTKGLSFDRTRPRLLDRGIVDHRAGYGDQHDRKNAEQREERAALVPTEPAE